MSHLSHVTVILARPSEPRNIGAACRAAKNFGVTDLAVVGNRGFDRDAARPLATGALDVFESIRHVDSLREAVADCALVAGTTRRTGQKRKLVNSWPWELGEQVAALRAHEADRRPNAADRALTKAGEPRAAIVFGNETSGLSDEELQECSIAVNIPTSELAPSLNLSHAVEVICYELWVASNGMRPVAEGSTGHAATLVESRPAGERESGGSVATGVLAAAGRSLVTAEEVRSAVERITASLEAVGFHSQDGPQGMGQLLRDVLGRATLSEPELKRLEGVFAKIAGMGRAAGGR